MAEYIFSEDALIILPLSSEESLELETLFTSKKIRFLHQFDHSQQSLHLPPDEVDRALQEIDLYQRENKNWKQSLETAQPEPPRSLSIINVCVILLLALFHWKISQFDSSPLWKEHGMLVAEKVLSGEWARTLTALTLHSGFSHLLGNFAALWLFSIGLGNRLGEGLAWLLILISGMVGNLGNALFYQFAHNSIGASTAVFGALGILGVIQYKHRQRAQLTRFKQWIPLGAALGLFAMLGSNPNSDVTAHIFGFVAGLTLGYGISIFWSEKIRQSKALQIVAFTVFSGLILLSWKIQQAPYNELFTL